MKILLITGTFPPVKCGVGDYTFYLAKHLAEKGNIVEVLTTRKAEKVGLKIPNLTVYPLMESWDFVDLLKMSDFIKRNAPDIVHVQFVKDTYNNEIAICFLPMFIKSRMKQGCKFFTTIHETGIPFKDSGIEVTKRRLVPLYKLLWTSLSRLRLTRTYEVLNVADENRHFNHEKVIGKMFEWIDGIIVVDNEYKKWLTEKISVHPSKIVHIPVGSNIERIPNFSKGDKKITQTKLGIRQDDTIVSFFGFIHRGKGLETLFIAFKQVISKRRKGPKPYLLIIGELNEVVGDRRYLYNMKKLSKELGIEKRVFWTGYCSSENVSRYLLSSDVCVLPYDEGVSFKRGTFITAISHGLPTITTIGTKIPDDLHSGKDVLLVPSNDPAKLAEAIMNLTNSKELLIKLKKYSTYLARKFSWESIVQKTMQTYQRNVCE